MVEAADHTISNTVCGINPHNSHGHIDLGYILHVHTLQLDWQQPATLNHEQDILGQRPQQTHVASAQPSYTPTDIQAAMHTLFMTPPNEQWYMDT